MFQLSYQNGGKVLKYRETSIFSVKDNHELILKLIG